MLSASKQKISPSASRSLTSGAWLLTGRSRRSTSGTWTPFCGRDPGIAWCGKKIQQLDEDRHRGSHDLRLNKPTAQREIYRKKLIRHPTRQALKKQSVYPLLIASSWVGSYQPVSYESTVLQNSATSPKQWLGLTYHRTVGNHFKTLAWTSAQRFYSLARSWTENEWMLNIKCQ